MTGTRQQNPDELGGKRKPNSSGQPPRFSVKGANDGTALMTKYSGRYRYKQHKADEAAMDSKSREIIKLRELVEAYEARLEIKHAYDLDGNLVPFPEGAPDGISARDETIKLLEKKLEAALDNAKYAWDNTRLIDKARMKAEEAARPVPLDPTHEMIEAGAQRLVHWEGDCKWPVSWKPLEVAAARTEAERVWRSMWLAAKGALT